MGLLNVFFVFLTYSIECVDLVKSESTVKISKKKKKKKRIIATDYKFGLKGISVVELVITECLLCAMFNK